VLEDPVALGGLLADLALRRQRRWFLAAAVLLAVAAATAATVIVLRPAPTGPSGARAASPARSRWAKARMRS
jgi:hypothetical protein